ncbi:hypothetical protein JCM17823_07270 [Halorubrum gandharaense]
MHRRRFLGLLGAASTAGVAVGSLALAGCLEAEQGAPDDAHGDHDGDGHPDTDPVEDPDVVDGDEQTDRWPEESFDVAMTADEFVPEVLTISVGDTVVWENTSSRAHTVTAYENAIPEAADYFASGGFDDERTAREAFWDEFGGSLENGDRYEVTFAEPGRYDYVCVPHEEGGMLGAVVVEE